MPIFKFKKAIVEEPPVATSTCTDAIAFLRENVLSPVRGLTKRLVPVDGVDSFIANFDDNRFSLTLMAVVLFTVAVCVHGFATRAPPPPPDEDKDKVEAKTAQQPRSVPASISVDDSEVTKLTAELTAASSSASSGADDDSVSSTEPGGDDEDQSVEETYEDFSLKIIDAEMSSDDALANDTLLPPFLTTAAAAEEATDAPVADDVLVDNAPANQATSAVFAEEATDCLSADHADSEKSTVEVTAGAIPDVIQEATIEEINIKETPEVNPHVSQETNTTTVQETPEVNPDGSQETNRTTVQEAPEVNPDVSQETNRTTMKEAPEAKRDAVQETIAEGTPTSAAEESVMPATSVVIPNKKPSLKKRLSIRMKRSTSSNSLASSGSIRRRLVKINSTKVERNAK